MACYIISYDLRSKKERERDYAQLIDAIKAFGRWAHITESTWAIVTDDDAVEVRDALLTVMEPGDRLFVVRSGVEAAWQTVMCHNEWLKKNL